MCYKFYFPGIISPRSVSVSSYYWNKQNDSYFSARKSDKTENFWDYFNDTKFSRNEEIGCWHGLKEVLLVLESDYFSLSGPFWRKHPKPHEYLLGATARYLNISFSKQPGTPGVFLEFTYQSKYPKRRKRHRKPKVLVLYSEESHFMYCRKNPLLKKTDLSSALLYRPLIDFHG